MRERLCTGVRALLAGLVLVASTALLQAAPVVVGDIEVNPDPEPRGEMHHGYTEYRFWVTNRSTERPYRVTVELPANRFGGRGEGSLRSVRRTIEVGPGQTSMLSLLQPAAPATHGANASVYVNGISERDKQINMRLVNGRSGISATNASRRYYSYGYGRGPSSGIESNLLLVSQRINEEFTRAGNTSTTSYPGGPPMPSTRPIGPVGGGAAGAAPGASGWPGGVLNNTQVLRAELGVSSWSNRWLAYTRYDGILLVREDIEELQRGTPTNREILQALWRYVEAGGVLIVLGPGEVTVPASWKGYSQLQRPQEVEIPFQGGPENRLGPMRGPVEGPGPAPRGDRDSPPLLGYSVGFGQCLIVPDRNYQSWTTGRWSQLLANLSQTPSPWRTTKDPFEQNNDFPVVDDLGVPVGGLFGLLFVFGVLIGPVNIAFLTRWKRRIWLLWTVPVLSALFCLMVLGYMIAAEGWSGHVRVAGLTLLDERERRATTLGKIGIYSPLTPGDGLRFSEETEVQIQGSHHSIYDGGCSIDWTGEQHLSRGWVSARVPAHYMLRKSEPQRRERIVVVREGKGLSAQNLLGVDINTLVLADDKGQLYQAEGVVAGAQVQLKPLGRRIDAARGSRVWRDRYSRSSWVEKEKTDRTLETYESMLVPNSYLALTDSNPFLESGLKGARVRPSLSVIVGLMP